MEEKAENPSILRMMRVRMMMRQMVRAKVLAQKRTPKSRARARPTFTAFPTVRGRERNPEDADPDGTETMDVQRTMEESRENLQRALQNAV